MNILTISVKHILCERAKMENTNLNEALTKKYSAKIVKPNEQSDTEPLKLKVYKRRWIMLIIYMYYNGAISAQWIEYSIITNIVSRYHTFLLKFKLSEI